MASNGFTPDGTRRGNRALTWGRRKKLETREDSEYAMLGKIIDEEEMTRDNHNHRQAPSKRTPDVTNSQHSGSPPTKTAMISKKCGHGIKIPQNQRSPDRPCRTNLFTSNNSLPQFLFTSNELASAVPLTSNNSLLQFLLPPTLASAVPATHEPPPEPALDATSSCKTRT